MPASGVPDGALCTAMNDAFCDYAVPMQLTDDSFGRMMQQRGLVRAVSWVARAEDGMAALWLVALRGRRAYLIASGTRPAFRGQGIAGRLAQVCLEQLRAGHALSFQTEVMAALEAQRTVAQRALAMKL